MFQKAKIKRQEQAKIENASNKESRIAKRERGGGSSKGGTHCALPACLFVCNLDTRTHARTHVGTHANEIALQKSLVRKRNGAKG